MSSKTTYSHNMITALSWVARSGRVSASMGASTVTALVTRGAIVGQLTVNGTIPSGTLARLTAEGWSALAAHGDSSDLPHILANAEADADEYNSTVPTVTIVAPVKRLTMAVTGHGSYTFDSDLYDMALSRTRADLYAHVVEVTRGMEIAPLSSLRKAELAAMVAEWETGTRDNTTVAAPAVDPAVRAAVGRRQAQLSVASQYSATMLDALAYVAEHGRFDTRKGGTIRTTIAALRSREAVAQNGYVVQVTASGWVALQALSTERILADAETLAHEADATRTADIAMHLLHDERMLAAPDDAVWYGRRSSTVARTDYDAAMAWVNFGPYTGYQAALEGIRAEVARERAMISARGLSEYSHDRLTKILTGLHGNGVLSSEVDGLKFHIFTHDQGSVTLPLGTSVTEYDPRPGRQGVRRGGRVVACESGTVTVELWGRSSLRLSQYARETFRRHELITMAQWRALPATERTDLDVDTLTGAASEATTRPSDFGYFGDVDLFDTWGMTFGQSAASDPVEESNYRVALAAIREACVFADVEPDEYVRDTNMGHWLVGTVDHLLVRVWEDEEHTRLTYPFVVATELATSLQDYPVLSEEDLSELENHYAEGAWDAYLSSAVRDEVGRTLNAEDTDDDTLSALMPRPLGAGESVEDLLRETYYAYEENYFYWEQGSGMVNDAHDAAVDHVVTTLFRSL